MQEFLVFRKFVVCSLATHGWCRRTVLHEAGVYESRRFATRGSGMENVQIGGACTCVNVQKHVHTHRQNGETQTRTNTSDLFGDEGGRLHPRKTISQHMKHSRPQRKRCSCGVPSFVFFSLTSVMLRSNRTVF